MAPAIFTGRESYVPFLAAYPFPAFVLEARPRPGKQGTCLQPVYGNTPYLHLFCRPEDCETVSSPPSLSSASVCGVVGALKDVEEARRLCAWIQRFPADDDENASSRTYHTIVLSLRPSWLPATDDALKLEITKTLMDGFWICTSVPKADLPTFQTLTPSPPSSPSSDKSRIISPKLRIPNFPSPSTPRQGQRENFSSSSEYSPSSKLMSLPPSVTLPMPPSAGPGMGPLAESNPLMRHARNPWYIDDQEMVPTQNGDMERMVETYPWDTTDLGPKDGWSQALKTALSICLQSPTSVSEDAIADYC